MNGVASFKAPAYLETNKKVNLIYGLNGTGKSTISNYLYEKDIPCFSSCNIEGLNNEDIRVYNQKFIQDYFYEPDNLKGIFTLSKENKDAKEKIRNAERECVKLETDKETQTAGKIEKEDKLNQRKQDVENKTWEIKIKFAGGDRVLEYCLDNLKGQKGKLFNYLASIYKPDKQPTKTTDQFKKEVAAIQGDDAQKYDLLPKIFFKTHEVEKKPILQKNIAGNKNSTVSSLINQLENSDWVKDGLQYLPEKIEENNKICPFCQNKTITKSLLEDIQGFFDESYKHDVNELKNLLSSYKNDISDLPQKETFEVNPYIIEKKDEFENLFNAVYTLLNQNKKEIESKIKTPSKKITLNNSTSVIENFNKFIEDINKTISTHNKKIDNKDTALDEIKQQFWALMRWDYDQTISFYQKEKPDIEKKIIEFTKKVEESEENISIQNQVIAEQQKKTVNIEKPITFINNGLIELGLDDFKLMKHSNSMYKIERSEQDIDIFHTLSEGEKMIISFLYFVEMCRGKKSADDVSGKKIIVIDDPISSLSHIFVFNIGRLIKNNFLKKDSIFEQVFVFTHSLYFFYELAYPKRRGQEDYPLALFRLEKNKIGSLIKNMKYHEIQNDYQSYWTLIKNENAPPALIANCMRNIIEHFFGFVEKYDLNAIFDRKELKENRFQAFYRYINRESHSDAVNIFDFKEFNHDDFKNGLRLLFEKNGYENHYKRMMK